MKIHRIFFEVVVFVLCQLAPPASAQKTSTPPRIFATAEEAAQALVAADEHNDTDELLKIFGSDGRELVTTGDEVQDNNRRQRFVEMAKRSLKIEPDPAAVNEFQITVGDRIWPFPIPIVKIEGGYQFDVAAGKTEILARRIGRNELKTIDALRDFAAAEHEYAYSDFNQNGMRDYAQKFISTPGKHDGLWWEEEPGGAESPLAKIVTDAIAEGYPPPNQGEASPYHGYIFRILKAQGPEAPGGARDYVVNGDMIGGFAFIAYPAEYDVTGVKTFLINHEGIVWEKDLGARTLVLASAIKAYNPDKTWTQSPVNEEQDR